MGVWGGGGGVTVRNRLVDLMDGCLGGRGRGNSKKQVGGSNGWMFGGRARGEGEGEQ